MKPIPRGISKFRFPFLSFFAVRLLISIQRVARIFLVSSADLSFLFFSFSFANSEKNVMPFASSLTRSFQDSSGLNAMISRSRSTMSFTATDWTRPAESPFLIFFQRTGDTLNHTRRSRTRRDCCALTRWRSIFPACLKASSTADLVISW